MEKKKLKGIVLAGGYSTRMGLDKGDIVYYDRAQKYWTADILLGVGLDSYISLRQEQDQSADYKYILDQYTNIGLIAGIISSLEYCQTGILALACDYPLMQASHLAELIINRDKSKMATVFMDESSNLLIPTIAIYEPEIVEVLKKAVGEGEYALQKILRKIDIKIISAQGNAFKSVDTLVDYQLVKNEINEASLHN